jgi:hypothetical protein
MYMVPSESGVQKRVWCWISGTGDSSKGIYTRKSCVHFNESISEVIVVSNDAVVIGLGCSVMDRLQGGKDLVWSMMRSRAAFVFFFQL